MHWLSGAFYTYFFCLFEHFLWIHLATIKELIFLPIAFNLLPIHWRKFCLRVLNFYSNALITASLLLNALCSSSMTSFKWEMKLPLAKIFLQGFCVSSQISFSNLLLLLFYPSIWCIFALLLVTRPQRSIFLSSLHKHFQYFLFHLRVLVSFFFVYQIIFTFLIVDLNLFLYYPWLYPVSWALLPHFLVSFRW